MPFNTQQAETVNKWVSEVERLRTHVKANRLPLSKTLGDMVAYCESNMRDDALIFPVKENPFKEKRVCTIL